MRVEELKIGQELIVDGLRRDSIKVYYISEDKKELNFIEIPEGLERIIKWVILKNDVIPTENGNLKIKGKIIIEGYNRGSKEYEEYLERINSLKN